jgi:hypothetical protein
MRRFKRQYDDDVRQSSTASKLAGDAPIAKLQAATPAHSYLTEGLLMSVAAELPLGKVAYEVTDEQASHAMLVMCQIGVQHVKDSLRQRGVPPEILLVALATVMAALAFSFVLADNSLPLWGLRALGVVAMLVLLYKAGLYFCPPFLRWYARRQSKRLIQGLRDRHVEWAFYEDRLETLSSAGDRTLPWSQLHRVVTLPGFWLLVFRLQPMLFMPGQFLPVEMQSLILRKAEEFRATIRDRT